MEYLFWYVVSMVVAAFVFGFLNEEPDIEGLLKVSFLWPVVISIAILGCCHLAGAKLKKEILK